jgi:hypothetical protein
VAEVAMNAAVLTDSDELANLWVAA